MLQGPREEVRVFGGGQPMPSPKTTRGCWDACPRAGWCSRARWAEEDRVEAAGLPCCCFPFPPRRGHLLGAFPRPVFRPGPLRWQLPPASDCLAWRQCTTGLCLFPPPGSPVLKRPRARASKGLHAAGTALEKMRVSSMLLCSAESSGMHPQSSSAPELEEMMLAQLHCRGDGMLPCSGHDSARQGFARSLNQNGRASAHRLLAPDHRADSFLRKDA